MSIAAAPARPASATGPISGGDGGTFASTLHPAANLFPTGSGAQRAVARDCGLSTPVPGGRSLWLFCDTAVWSDVTGSAPEVDGTLRFIPSGTAALARTEVDPSPSDPIQLAEAAYPAQPTQVITSGGRYGVDRLPISCRGGAASVAWTSGLVTLPGTSTVLAFFQDHCPDIESGYAEYDVGVGEIELPEVPDGDLTGASEIRVTRRTDSVLVNPNPGSVSEFGHRMGAVVDGDHIYLYEARAARASCSGGTCTITRPGRLTLARVPWAGGEYRDGSQYRYYTGNASDPWSADRNAAVDLISDGRWPAGDGLSVAWVPQVDRYVMAHSQTSLGWRDGMALRTAPTPWGPWSAPVELAPTAGSSLSNPTGGCSTATPCRSAYLHPQLTGPSGRLHISYVRHNDFATTSGQPVRFAEEGSPMRVRLTSVPLDELPRPSPLGTDRPGAPTAVSATAGDGRATVRWSAPASSGSAPIVGYRLTPYVAGVAGSPTMVSSTATTAVVRGLANGTPVTVRVQAVSAAGAGTLSAPSASVTPVGAPRAPSAVVAQAGDRSVSLSWTAPTSNGGSAITGYEVTPYVDGVALAPRVLSSTATSKVIGNLSNGTRYRFRVAARNALGLSGGSAPSAEVTPVGAPGAPTAVVATPGNEQVLLEWTAPTSTGGSPITGYVVTPSVGGVAQAPRVLVGTATSKYISNLRNGTTYTFTVAATNAVGTGTPSAPSGAVTPRTLPDPPTVTGAVPGDRSVTVSWTPPAFDGGQPITGYQITPFAAGVAQPPVEVGKVTSHKVTGLANGVSHRFVVKARTAVGLGLGSEFSEPATPRTVPGRPTAVVGTAGNGLVTVSWTAPSSDGGTSVTGYRITPWVGSTPLAVRELTLPGTSIIVSGLTNGIAHTFTVVAVNGAGAGAASAASAAVTPRTVPGAPQAVRATASAPGEVTVSWSPPAFDGGAAVTGYRVVPFVGGVALDALDASASPFTIRGLLPGTSVRYVVRAVNAAGLGASSDFSEPVTVTAPTIAPYAPYSSWSDLVDGLHRDVLGRPPTAAERSTWIARLQTGTATPGALVVDLRGSTDHTANVDPVARLYRAYFLRVPDQAGLEHWIGERRDGRGLGSISSAFAGSREFQQRYGSLSDAQFMDLIYRQVLERAPDPTGYAFWVAELRSGRRTRGSVMVGFSEASEYRQRYGTFVDAVIAHVTLLDRAPTVAEVSTWRTRSSGGASHALLAGELVASPEHSALVAG